MADDGKLARSPSKFLSNQGGAFRSKKKVDEDGELARSPSKLASMNSSGALWKKKAGSGDSDDGELTARSPSVFASMNSSGALWKGKKKAESGDGDDDGGELTARSPSKFASMNSSGALWKKKAAGDGEDDDGELTRSPSMLQSMKASGALGGTTKPTQLKMTVRRTPGNRIGLELNKRNRVCRIDAGTPAAKAGLLVMDLVVTVSGIAAEGRELIELIDRDATEIAFEVERPHKSQHKKIIAQDNAHEKAALKMVQVTMVEVEEEKKKSLPTVDGPPTASTKSLQAAGFALKKAD